MAGIDLVITPARLALGAPGERSESVSGRDPCGIDIAARQRQFSTMQLELRLETSDWHVYAALVQPREVGFRRVWRCRIWRHPPLASPGKFLHARPRRFVQIE